MRSDAPVAVGTLQWWHTIDIAPVLVTPGAWELRPAVRRMPWPSDGDLRGLRCLDVGTMDGFWAFEMERRGAAEVVALDLVRGNGMRPTFTLALELLDSRVSFIDLDVHDLDPATHGRFDLIFMGYVAELLSDPIVAFQAVRRVCRGTAIVLDQVSLPLSLLPRPLSRVAARPGYQEWFLFNRRGFERALDATGFDVDGTSGFLRDRPGPGVRQADFPLTMRARHTLGLAGVSLALRGRPRPD